MSEISSFDRRALSEISSLDSRALAPPPPPDDFDVLTSRSGPKSDSDLLHTFAAFMITRDRLHMNDRPLDYVTSQSYQTFLTVMGELYPQILHPPCRDAVHKMMSRYKNEGVLRRKKTGGRKAHNHDEAVQAALVVENEPASVREAQFRLEADGIKLCRKTIANVAKKVHGLLKMKRNIGQALTPDAVNRRQRFANMFLERLNFGHIDLKNICFTDESLFGPGHHVNRHNEIVWRKPGPETDRELENMRVDRQKKGHEVHAFVVLHHKLGAVGPWFIDEIPDETGKPNSNILTGQKYVHLLKNFVFPKLKELLGSDYDTMIWQQDGASSHTCRESLDFLFHEFGEGRVITSRGRRQPHPIHMEWPPYSPDLTPLDFSFWPIYKKTVGILRARTKPQLKLILREQISACTDDVVKRMIDDIPVRLRCLQHARGKHIEGRALRRYKKGNRDSENQKSCENCGLKHWCYCDFCMQECRDLFLEQYNTVGDDAAPHYDDVFGQVELGANEEI